MSPKHDLGEEPQGVPAQQFTLIQGRPRWPRPSQPPRAGTALSSTILRRGMQYPDPPLLDPIADGNQA